MDDGSCRYNDDPAVCANSTIYTAAVLVQLADCEPDFEFAVSEAFLGTVKGPYTHFGSRSTEMILCLMDGTPYSLKVEHGGANMSITFVEDGAAKCAQNCTLVGMQRFEKSAKKPFSVPAPPQPAPPQPTPQPSPEPEPESCAFEFETVFSSVQPRGDCHVTHCTDDCQTKICASTVILFRAIVL